VESLDESHGQRAVQAGGADEDGEGQPSPFTTLATTTSHSGVASPN
jgi:hypothetical protein